MPTVNWAILGCGRIADVRIAPGLRNSKVNNLAAIISRDEARAAELAARHGAGRSYASLEAALRDPTIDVLYVGTPNALHVGPAVAACRAGKHVFCDKPMALSVEDCVAMIRAADENGVKLGIGFNNRYNPAHQEIRRRIVAGVVGHVEYASAQFFIDRRRANWRLDAALAGGGAVYDMAPHLVDFLRFMLASEVARVTALLDYDTYGVPLDSQDHALLEFESGTVVALHVSSKIPYPGNFLQYYGSEGTLVARDTMVSQLAGGIPPCGTLEMTTADGTDRVDFPAVDVFRAELEAFGRAVADGGEPDIGGLDGLRAQEICLAMQESARTGRAVSITRWNAR